MNYVCGYLFLQFKDGSKFHQINPSQKVYEFSVFSFLLLLEYPCRLSTVYVLRVHIDTTLGTHAQVVFIHRFDNMETTPRGMCKMSYRYLPYLSNYKGIAQVQNFSNKGRRPVP